MKDMNYTRDDWYDDEDDTNSKRHKKRGFRNERREKRNNKMYSALNGSRITDEDEARNY